MMSPLATSLIATADSLGRAVSCRLSVAQSKIRKCEHLTAIQMFGYKTNSMLTEKQQAIQELKLTPVTRTYLQFRHRVWEDSKLDGYGITDLDIQNTYSPTLTQSGTRGILTSYTGGQRALDIGALSEDQRQSTVLRGMRNLFGNLNGEYETGLSQIWHQDQYARGAFTYFEPGQMATLLPIAQRPEGRIHFAGEHTSAWHGWMNGALESGNRAADEVNSA